MATASRFQRASKKKSRLRMAICGPTGSGKTFTALRIAYAFKGAETRVAVINTESGAIEKYLGLAPDGIPFNFDILTLEEYPPTAYTEAIMEAGRLNYDVLVIDSLSHAWTGVGGALEIKDNTGGNSYTAWKDVTPMHNRMIEAILRSPCHLIVTMRSKMEYVLEERNGKMVPQRVGMAPVQRQGMEYEFDVVADMDLNHMIKVSKSRCPAIDSVTTIKPGVGFLSPVVEWLNEGSDVDPSYYAVTDDDLRILERKENTSLSNAERLAKARESQAAAVAAMFDQAGPPKCTELLERQIKTVLPESGISVEALQAQFARMGVAKIRELTLDDAERLYHKLLQRKSEKMQADAAAKLAASGTVSDVSREPNVPPPAPAAPDPVAPEIPPAQRVPKCGPELEAEIRSLLPQAKVMPEKFREMLTRYGVGKICDLFEHEARAVRDDLLAKVNGAPSVEDVPFDVDTPARGLCSRDEHEARSDSDVPGSVTPAQLEQIKQLVNAVGWPHERQTEWLRERHVTSFRSISQQQAGGLIEKMQAATATFAGSAKN